jgi:hypothetical protein
MGRLRTPFQDRSRTQLLDVSGEIHIHHHRLAGQGPPTCYIESRKKRPMKKHLRSCRTAPGSRIWPQRISQLKTRTQDAGETIQEFYTAVEQLAHRTYTALPEDNLRRKVGKTFAEGMELAIKSSCC